MKLREEQDKAVSAASNEFKIADRTTIQMACGSGKTLVGATVALQLQANITVVCAPTIYLCRQNADEWNRVFEYNQILVNTEHTLDPAIIQSLIVANQRNVIFVTYHSLGKVAESLRDETIDLIVFDEAHNTIGHGFWRFGIDNRNIKATKRLFITATRNVYTDDAVLHMDNEKWYGKVCFDYTFMEAVKDKRLCDFKVIVPVISKGTDGWNNSPDIISKIIKKVNLKKGLTFHSNTKRATKFGQLLNTSGIAAHTITSKTQGDARDQIINEWKIQDPPAVITNCRIFGEGVNIPAVDFVGIMDRRQSSIALIQIIGRTMRLSAGKKYGYVIIPIVVTDETSIDDAMATNYRSLRHVVEALQMLDSGFAALIERHKQSGDPKLKKQILARFDIDDNDVELFDRIVEDIAVGFYRSDTLEEQKRLLKDTDLSPAEIADRLGLVHGSVYNTNRKYNIRPRKTNMIEQQIHLLKTTDWSCIKIAKKLGVAPATVAMTSKRLSVRPRRQNTVPQQLHLLKTTSLSFQEIGQELGIYMGVVRSTNRRYKIRELKQNTTKVA